MWRELLTASAVDSDRVETVLVVDADLSLAYSPVVKVLGNQFSHTGTLAEELSWRVERAWASFWALRPLLLRKHVPLGSRLRLLGMTVLMGMQWGSESTHYREFEFRRLDTVHTLMVRTMMNCPRRSDLEETWVEYDIRTMRLARAHIWKHGEVLSSMIARKQWRWWGHVMRLDSTRTIRRILEWRGLPW